MSGLNAIEMSSLRVARRACVYRRAFGPDSDESARAGPAQGHGPGVAGAADAGRGGAVGGPVSPPGPARAAQAGAVGRCGPGAWAAGQALEPAIGCQAAPQGADSLSTAVCRLRSDLCQREAGRARTDREPGHAAALAAGRGPVA